MSNFGRQSSVAILTIVFGSIISAIAISPSFAITQDEAIEISDKEFQKFLKKWGYDTNKYQRMFDVGNKKWEEESSYYRDSSTSQGRRWFEEKERPLKGKSYYAIRYSPASGIEVKDGIYWVFVDSKTGKVLLFFY